MCCILLSLETMVENRSSYPARHAHRSRVALAQAAATSDSLVHFPASQKLILAWQTLPLMTDFTPTTPIPPCKQAQISHHSEESLWVSFALFLSLHEVQSGSISFKINFSAFLKKCCMEIKHKPALSFVRVFVLCSITCGM